MAAAAAAAVTALVIVVHVQFKCPALPAGPEAQLSLLLPTEEEAEVRSAPRGRPGVPAS